MAGDFVSPIVQLSKTVLHIVFVTIVHMSGWNRMTPREEWMLMANMLIPGAAVSSEDARDQTQYILDLSKNIDLTRRAIKMGIALSALDGPLPVMDTVAFVGVSIYTTVLWSQFYLDYY